VEEVAVVTGWRVCIRTAPGEAPVGMGFVATGDTALTCAHVVSAGAVWWVEYVGTGRGAFVPTSVPLLHRQSHGWVRG
jgi:hypothetical protein